MRVGVRFDKKALKKALLNPIIEEQNKRLVEYAKEKIIDIGNEVKTYHSRHNMDRTGNLLDSLCWGVSYQGKLIDGGFYREASARGESFLHEWFSGDTKYLIPVNGRALAESYLQKYGNGEAKAWKVFFAILAPYWGYWEKGFTLRTIGGSRHVQFAVMAQFYDSVKRDLKPARTRFRVSVAKYERVKLEKKWRKYAGY